MLYHQKTNWKNTISFRMVFDIRNLGLNKSQYGFIHFAEHLMFVRTKKYNQNLLRTKRDLFFDVLDAYTNVNSMSITVVCHRSNLKEVAEVLKEMIFAWTSDKKLFNIEKKYIIEEINNHNEQSENDISNLLQIDANDSDKIVLGNPKKLNFSDLKEIKNVWNKMLKVSPRNLLIASPQLTKEEEDIFDKLFDSQMFSKKIVDKPDIPLQTKYIEKNETAAISFKKTKSELFFIFLQRIYYIRHLLLTPKFAYSFDRDAENLYYAVYNEIQNINSSEAKKFLCKKPSKIEFLKAKDILLTHIDSLIDANNSIEVIEWMDIFHLSKISELEGKSFSQIRKIYEKYFYDNFLKDWKKFLQSNNNLN